MHLFRPICDLNCKHTVIFWIVKGNLIVWRISLFSNDTVAMLLDAGCLMLL